DFRTAVLAACGMAQPGDIVILSPACASFDKFKNFMERGNAFKKIIYEL
ncbi:MAG: UDP-N-acetylmuramoyl-L-alanine--D-glutamate ligase, partial [Oscillospiraceae bacterium]